MVTKSIKGVIQRLIFYFISPSTPPPLNKVICARPLANNDLNWVTKSRLRSCCVPCQTPLKRRCPILSLLSLVFLYVLSLSFVLCLATSLSRSLHLFLSISLSPSFSVSLPLLSLSLHLSLMHLSEVAGSGLQIKYFNFSFMKKNGVKKCAWNRPSPLEGPGMMP